MIVATLRGLKANSGLYDLRPGQAVPDALFAPDSAALQAGFANLKWHIDNVNQYGVPAVVAINRFPQDCAEELEQLVKLIEALPNRVSVAISEGFAKGGEGTKLLAEKWLSSVNIQRNSLRSTIQAYHWMKNSKRSR